MVYHLLSSHPQHAATELEKLHRDWGRLARPEDRYALAAALSELEKAGLVQGRGRLWSLLVIAWVRVDRGESAQLLNEANESLRLARAEADVPAESEAQCLLGDVLQAQGQLGEAQAAFGEVLAISRRLAEQDPSNAGWQRDLAVALNRVGDVLQAQGQLDEAQAAFGEMLAISRRLAEQDRRAQ